MLTLKVFIADRHVMKRTNKDKPLRIEQLSYAIPEALTRRHGKLAVWIIPQPSKPGPAVFGATLLEQP